MNKKAFLCPCFHTKQASLLDLNGWSFGDAETS
jgi:hypothetical protein